LVAFESASKTAEDEPTEEAVYHPNLHPRLIPLCPHHPKTNWENDASSHDTLLMWCPPSQFAGIQTKRTMEKDVSMKLKAYVQLLLGIDFVSLASMWSTSPISISSVVSERGLASLGDMEEDELSDGSF
jgi:hypothetical protein